MRNCIAGRSAFLRPLTSKPEDESKVYVNLYDDIIHDNSPQPKPKFAVGNEVRITKKQSQQTVFIKSLQYVKTLIIAAPLHHRYYAMSILVYADLISPPAPEFAHYVAFPSLALVLVALPNVYLLPF
jgi:hypothetical protein